MNNDTSSRAGEAKRIRFNFWLDMAKDLDTEIKSLITTLKDERLFTQTIRDGLRLMNNLRQGKLDVLFELFPWVKAEFMDYMRELQPVSEAQPQPVQSIPQPQPDPEPQTSKQQSALETQNELLRDMVAKQDERIADLEQKLDQARPAHVDFESLLNSVASRIEQKLDTVTMPAVGQMPPNSPNSLGGLKPLGSSSGLNSLTTQTFDAPIYDDDDELEVSKAKSSGKAALNFLQSLSAIQKQ